MKKSILFFVLTVFLFSFTACSSGSNDSGNKDDGYEGSNEIFSGSGPVMLQVFDWSSNHYDRYNSCRANDSSSSHKTWYEVISENASDIGSVFEYAWFPPASDSGSVNGYLPRKLNVLDSEYGTSEQLSEAVSAVGSGAASTKAIADVVINHRVGTSNWGTFTNPSFGTVSGSNYYAICSDDEGFSSSGSDMYGVTACGTPDSGEGYSAARDLDHQNYDLVQCGIVDWMTDVLKKAGFTGWRYDYVKGYGGKYVGYYNSKTSAAFSVGEYWPTDGFSSNNPAAWYNEINGWIESTDDTVDNGQNVTGTASRAFDFVTKGMLNTVFGYSSTSGSTSGSFNYALLNNDCLLWKKSPSSAVTFVDNHDTGSTQSHWKLNDTYVAAAYAYILTHPGYPCVAWQHYFTAPQSYDTTVSGNSSQYLGGSNVPGITSLTYHDFIASLVSLRGTKGICETSSVTVKQADTTRYAAEITGNKGSVYVVIGTAFDQAPDGFTLLYSGTKFQVYE